MTTAPSIISRQEAHVKGLKRFYTGEPCKRDHVAERFVSNGACVLCQNWTNPSRKMPGPKGTNVGWPHRGLVFQTPGVQAHEMTAAFLFIEAMGWLDAALQELRKNPELMKRYTPLLTPQEQAKLRIALDADQAARRAIAGEIED